MEKEAFPEISRLCFTLGTGPYLVDNCFKGLFIIDEIFKGCIGSNA